MFASDLDDKDRALLEKYLAHGSPVRESKNNEPLDDAAAVTAAAAELVQHYFKRPEMVTIGTQTEVVTVFDGETQTNAKWFTLDRTVPITAQLEKVTVSSSCATTDFSAIDLNAESKGNAAKGNGSKRGKDKGGSQHSQTAPKMSISLSPYANMTDAVRLEQNAKKINDAYDKSVQGLSTYKARKASQNKKAHKTNSAPARSGAGEGEEGQGQGQGQEPTVAQHVLEPWEQDHQQAKGGAGEGGATGGGDSGVLPPLGQTSSPPKAPQQRSGSIDSNMSQITMTSNQPPQQQRMQSSASQPAVGGKTAPSSSGAAKKGGASGKSTTAPKQENNPGKKIVQRARECVSSDEKFRARPHTKTEKVLMQNPLAEPYFSRIQAEATPQYVLDQKLKEEEEFQNSSFNNSGKKSSNRAETRGSKVRGSTASSHGASGTLSGTSKSGVGCEGGDSVILSADEGSVGSLGSSGGGRVTSRAGGPRREVLDKNSIEYSRRNKA